MKIKKKIISLILTAAFCIGLIGGVPHIPRMMGADVSAIPMSAAEIIQEQINLAPSTTSFIPDFVFGSFDLPDYILGAVEDLLPDEIHFAPLVTIQINGTVRLDDSLLSTLNVGRKNIMFTGTGTIEGKSTGTGPAITVGDLGRLIIDGITVTHPEENERQGVGIGNSGALIIRSGRITGNGTGVVNSRGRFSMSGGIIDNNSQGVYNSGLFAFGKGYIEDNHGNFGSGVANNPAGTFVLDGGTIRNNHTTGMSSGGGGIYSDGAFIMISGAVYGNSASRDLESRGIYHGVVGGGIYIAGGTAEITGGTISDNTADEGGGIYKRGGSNLFMSNVTISRNTAVKSGGGIYNDGRITMNSGIIENNNAPLGGGISVGWGSGWGGLFIMNSGAIINNSASESGGGIYVHCSRGARNDFSNTLWGHLELNGGVISGDIAYQPYENVVPPNAANVNIAMTQPSSWAVTQVTEAVSADIGPQSLQSSYTQATTRAEFCALAAALYENIKGEITGRTTFTDTNDVNVQKAAYIGVVSGVGDNRFDPNAQLTREQAAVMLARLADAIGKPFAAQAPTFADNSLVSSWAVDGVGAVQAAGIMSGVGDNRFAPQDPYTREQSIVTILRVFNAVQ
jgi:predicted outer membrane repeat protein